MPIIKAFPVELGYGTGYCPDRCIFVADIAIILVFVNVSYVLGLCIKNSLSENKKMYLIEIGIALGILLSFNIDNYRIQNNCSLHILRSLEDKTYQNYYNKCSHFYKSLENYEGEDVIVSLKDFPEKIHTLNCFNISEDPNWWENIVVSTYYNLDSIRLVE